jgi:hypothetical protein
LNKEHQIMSIIRNLCNVIMGLAALAMASTPTIAAAQDAAVGSAPATTYAVGWAPPATTISLVEVVKGVALPADEAAKLLNDGCLVGPLSTTRGLYDWAERKGVTACSPEFYRKVDTYIGKESTVAFRVARGADGYEVCQTMKVANLGNDRESCRTYPFNAAYNRPGEIGKYADVNWAAGGGTMTAQIGGSLLGALIAGPGTAATGALLQKTCDHCNSPTFNVGGGSSVALADSAAVSNSALNAAISSGTGGCTSCGYTTPVATEPKH